MPDLHERRLERAASQGDGEAAIALGYRLRSTRPQRRLRGRVVSGLLLATALSTALEATGKREVELLREAGVAPRHLGRWIRALRVLMAGDARAAVWVDRWCALLGVEQGALQALAQPLPPGTRTP